MKKLFVFFFCCVVPAVFAGYIPDEEIEKVFGSIRFVDRGEACDYRVVIDEACPDLNVERVDSAVWAARPGLWYITENGNEDFAICIVGEEEIYDFSIRFVGPDGFPGLN